MPLLSLPQVYLLLTCVLPRQSFDPNWAIAVLQYRQNRNYAAYLSHRRRRLKMYGQLSDISL